jgi:RNA polymerase sigma-70 factor, ECF subfamily
MSPVPGDRYGNPSAPGEPATASSSDPDALAAELSHRFRDRLRFFAARRLRDRNLAEDVAQETLRRVLEALRAGRVQNLEALPGFLFETARHICQQRSRSDGREAKAYQRLAGPGGEEPRLTSDPLADLITEERREAVRLAFSHLAEGDQALLTMSYVEGLETEEIARRLDAQPGAIRVRRHRAVRRLAEILGVTKEKEREQP